MNESGSDGIINNAFIFNRPEYSAGNTSNDWDTAYCSNEIGQCFDRL
jgi:hypothetical protein